METAMSLSEKFNRLVESSKEYLEDRVELEVLKGADKIAQGMSVFVLFLCALVMGMVILIILSFGFALWINRSMQSELAGYFIVAGALSVVLVLFFLVGGKSIKRTVINKILNNIDND